MKTIALLFSCFFLCNAGSSQPSDFLVIKKNQRTLKSFFAGSNISFVTARGNYSGEITSVKKDSLFISQYDVRQVPTNLGVYVLDTVATYRIAFNYREIIKIVNDKRRGFSWAASGGSLLGGGVLLAGSGLATWIFTKPGTRYYASPALVISGAVLAGVGYLLLRSNGSYFTIGEKYRLEYVKVK